MNDNAIAPTILLVDSSSRSREEKQYGLTQRGYEVILVENNDQPSMFWMRRPYPSSSPNFMPRGSTACA